MSRARTATTNATTAAGLNAAPLTSSEVTEVIEVAVSTPMDGYPGKAECKWGLPLLIEGLPGTAKTARIKQVAASMSSKLEIVFAAPHAPEDFSGVLIPDGKGDANQVAMLAQIRRMMKSERGIMFFDELNGAPPATQGALMSLLHERHSGDVDLPPKWRMLAAQNPEEIATGGNRLSPPLANRFIHITDPGPDAREWITWLMGSSQSKVQMSLEKIEEVITSDWPNQYPITQGLFAGFIDKLPSNLHMMPSLSDPNSGKAWASHRTWDFATRAWTAACILEKSDSIRDAVLQACVGEAATEMFLVYQKEANIPKPMDVITGKWKLDKNRLDIVLAAYTGAVAYVKQRPTRPEKVKLAPMIWASIFKLFEAGLSDIVVPAAEGLVQERLGNNSGDETIRASANQVLVALANGGLAKHLEART
jgi:hypothetical protein